MSKKLHDYYYEYTCPPSSESSTSAPSAPSIVEITSPPPYENLIHPAGHAPAPPTHDPGLAGYVRDESVIISGFDALPEHTGDYDPREPLLQPDHDEFSGRPPPPSYSVYRAPFKVQEDGVLSRDNHLNRDGEALAQFLYQHNTAPSMSVRFYGTARTQQKIAKD